MKCLILFSGTGSIEKVMNKEDTRGLDISNKYKPYYHIDILKWDYENELKNWVPDYIHSSFVCCKVSTLNKDRKTEKNLKETYILVDKTIEIIEYVRTLNPNIKFTIENPNHKATLEYPPLTHYKYKITSYCKYGFGYKKPTIFWYGGFDLELKQICKKGDKVWCKSRKKNDGIHWLRLGVSRNSKLMKLWKNQVPDIEHFRELKKLPEYKGYSYQDFRFRIPEDLVKDIYNGLKKII